MVFRSSQFQFLLWAPSVRSPGRCGKGVQNYEYYVDIIFGWSHSLHDIVMRIGGVDLDEDVSVADNNDTNRTVASPRYGQEQ